MYQFTTATIKSIASCQIPHLQHSWHTDVLPEQHVPGISLTQCFCINQCISIKIFTYHNFTIFYIIILIVKIYHIRDLGFALHCPLILNSSIENQKDSIIFLELYSNYIRCMEQPVQTLDMFESYSETNKLSSGLTKLILMVFILTSMSLINKDFIYLH